MTTIRTQISKLFGVDKIVERKVLEAVAKEGAVKGSLKWAAKQIYRTRSDVKTWGESQALVMDAEWPKNYLQQLLYDEMRLDALLTSQIENRKQKTIAAKFSLKKENGEKDDDSTQKLKSATAYRHINDAILESKIVDYNMIELFLNADKTLGVTLIPRTNYTPQNGRFYADFMEDKFTEYRKLPEYGKWLLEFIPGNQFELGMLNKAVPHVLFKRFAQSCWSELCEIYGIPPRFMKTNTRDPKMLNRADTMMRDMGAAAYFIIDNTEAFEFAEGVATNGDVYKNLINLSNNEISLLFNGAIIGQDTVHGNRSKDESAQGVLADLVEADKEYSAAQWTNIVLPALAKIGFLPAGLTFEYEPGEDIDQLFKFTTGLLPFKEIDNEWLNEKFGVKVLGNKIQPTAPDNNTQNLSAFFD